MSPTDTGFLAQAADGSAAAPIDGFHEPALGVEAQLETVRLLLRGPVTEARERLGRPVRRQRARGKRGPDQIEHAAHLPQLTTNGAVALPPAT